MTSAQDWPPRSQLNGAVRNRVGGQLADLYGDHGIRELVELTGYSFGLVRRLLQEAGVQLMPAGRPSHRRRLRSPLVEPTLARLRLRRLLRDAREKRGLTQDEVAAALGMSRSKPTRIESGEVRVSIPDVRALLDLYDANDLRAEAEQLARAAMARSGVGYYREVLSVGDMACYSLEAAAASIDYVDMRGIHPLLATDEYARYYATARRLNPRRTNLLVEAWQLRRRLLDDPPVLRFWLDESAVHRGADNPVVQQQWRHILQVAEHPRITVSVVPFTAGVLAASVSLAMLEIPEPAETLMWIDRDGGGLVRAEQPADLEAGRDLLAWLGAHARPVGELPSFRPRTMLAAFRAVAEMSYPNT